MLSYLYLGRGWAVAWAGLSSGLGAGCVGAPRLPPVIIWHLPGFPRLPISCNYVIRVLVIRDHRVITKNGSNWGCHLTPVWPPHSFHTSCICVIPDPVIRDHSVFAENGSTGNVIWHQSDFPRFSVSHYLTPCMCVYTYMCTHLYIFVYVCIHTYSRSYIYTPSHACTYIYVHIHIHIHPCLKCSVFVSGSLCLYLCVILTLFNLWSCPI